MSFRSSKSASASWDLSLFEAMRSEVVCPKRLPQSFLPVAKRDECFRRGAVFVPIFFVLGTDSLGIERKRRIPIGHREFIGDAFDRRRECAIVGRAGELHDGRQFELGGFFLDLPVDAFRLEIGDFDRIADLGLQISPPPRSSRRFHFRRAAAAVLLPAKETDRAADGGEIDRRDCRIGNFSAVIGDCVG